ncbi:hypothetical protein FRB99_001304 [Tulasnella sp. 403]|nr:hypothetical protein FRB99_001304 [Tulasnella sp. 403]
MGLTIRYLAITFSIVTQAVLGVLAIGNLASHLPQGSYLYTNCSIAISGVLSALFMTLITVIEMTQKEASTTNALFEIVWVVAIWAITIVEASYVSTTELAGCSTSSTTKSELCIPLSISIPLSWGAVFFITVHLALLVFLVSWHRFRVEVSAPAKRGRLASVSEDQDTGRLRKIWRRMTAGIRREYSLLTPILSQSVYVLLKKKYLRQVEARKAVAPITPIDGGFDVREKSPPIVQEPLSSGDWTASYYFKNSHSDDSPQQEPEREPTPVPQPPAPVYNINLPIGDMPRYQLKDEPIYTSPDADTPRSPRATDETPRRSARRPHLRMSSLTKQNHVVFTSPLVTSPTPLSPRTPNRSRTLPSMLASPRAQLLGNRLSALVSQLPGLQRSATVGATRRFIPSRYKDMDLSIPNLEASDSIKAPPRLPPGLLPRPTRRNLT